MTRALAIGAAITIALMGVACWLLFKEVEGLKGQIGKLEQSNRQLTETVNAKTNATKQRARAEQVIRDLPDDDLARRLR